MYEKGFRKAPCKDCPDRWIDPEKGTRCHSTCEKWSIFSEQKAKFNEDRSKSVLNDHIFMEYKAERKAQKRFQKRK